MICRKVKRGALIYVTLKPYPMDYDAEGKLLVNPQKMMNGCYKACGGNKEGAESSFYYYND